MKKVFFFAAAALALSFTSCGNKNAANAEIVDSAAVAAEVVEDEAGAEAVVSDLQTLVENKDVEGLKAKLAEVQEGIAAGKYSAEIEKIKTFITENEATIKSVVGSEGAIASLIETVKAIPTDAQAAAGEAADAAKEAVDGAKDAAKTAVDNAKEEAAKKVDEATTKAKEEAAKKVDEAASKATDKLKGKLGI